MYPPIVSVPKEVTEEIELNGVKIPPGCTIGRTDLVLPNYISLNSFYRNHGESKHFLHDFRNEFKLNIIRNWNLCHSL